MIKCFSREIMRRVHARLERLYGARSARCMERLAMMMGRYGVGLDGRDPPRRWDETTSVLITYGDMVHTPGEYSLSTLRRFLESHLRDAVSAVHILPFFPYSSDDGFSVIDYREVNPMMGGWTEVEELGRHFELMFDLVLNHVSRRGPWFQNYVTRIAPFRDYFIEMDPRAPLGEVVRPRGTPLLSPVMTRDGARHVWTTFGADQIDLNFANPDVLFEFLDIVLYYISRGARILRLDAIAYLWKEPGTPCIHLPQTHEVVKLFRDVLEMAAPGTLILTETNVPHRENISYFGEGDEAHMVYQFSLAPLLLHALQTGNASYLTKWAASLPELPGGCTYLNFTASHDGIGVRPLEGLIPDREFGALIAGIPLRGGHVSTRTGPEGEESPYELNITYYDALSDPESNDSESHIARFLCSQTIAMAMRGVPAVYFNALAAAPNDREGVERTGRFRSINRKKWDKAELDQILHNPGTSGARVFREYIRRLKIRRQHSAFHPDGGQIVHNWGPSLFVFERFSPNGGPKILCVNNCSGQPAELAADGGAGPRGRGAMRDLLSGGMIDFSKENPRVAPYQSLWLGEPL